MWHSVSDVKAAVAAIRFILCNAVKYDVEEQVSRWDFNVLTERIERMSDIAL